MAIKTTIKISSETKKRLDNLKEFERETYEEIIKKTLHVLNLLKNNPSLGSSVLARINSNIRRRLQEEKEEKRK
jgi:predicted DNA-binding protein